MAGTSIPGLVIAGPASNSGKTFLTLALLRALRNVGVRVASAKAGPDYIDPAFHAAASGRACVNLDVWAMRPETLGIALAQTAEGADLLICEGVMGLFDGAVLDQGSTADLAAMMGWPVVLVVDAGAQAASAAALVRGFATHRDDTRIAGVIFNRVGSARHLQILSDAMAAALPDIPVLGGVLRAPDLVLPNRHLGLVQAGERADLEAFLDSAAAHVADGLDLTALQALARPAASRAGPRASALTPLGQRIAVARDTAFAFTYPHLLDAWRRVGAELSFFSPLANEAPDGAADSVYLPGGYPELHAGQLAANQNFLAGLRAKAEEAAHVFGECGGYMTLGKTLIDEDGTPHSMAGLLPLVSSFAKRKLHLGYRQLEMQTETPLGPTGAAFRGHEFHYASVIEEGGGNPLFQARNAAGDPLGPVGRVVGSVAGSFIHLIDMA